MSTRESLLTKSSVRTSFFSFLRDRRGATSVVFALSLIPVGVCTGAAIDIGRAVRQKVRLQAALDSAVLAAVQISSSTDREALGQGLYVSQTRGVDGETGTPVFTLNSDSSLSGTVTATVPVTMMQLVGRSTMPITVRAKASKAVTDKSCILALAGGIDITNDAITLNGASNLDLSGCDLRSNASIKCNGHSGNADTTIASGSVSGSCNNAVASAVTIEDVHAGLASNITKPCGTTSNNIIWNAGSMPSAPDMITVLNAHGITEYHLCGNVTVKGTGALVGSSSADTVVVVENGSLTMFKDADVTMTRTSVILTGSASSNHQLAFPTGNGNSAALSITPPTSTANPWRSVAMYQDPSLTANVNMNWGPGATLNVDGLMYFPKADVTFSGIAQSNASQCTKLVVKSFTSNGAVDMNQSTTACDAMGLTQYKESSRLLY